MGIILNSSDYNASISFNNEWSDIKMVTYMYIACHTNDQLLQMVRVSWLLRDDTLSTSDFGFLGPSDFLIFFLHVVRLNSI